MLIDDSTPADVVYDPRFTRGAVPRDFAAQPADTFAAMPAEMPLIPRSEWSARCREQAERRARLSDVRNAGDGGRPIPSLDQNYGDGVRWGYCWAHSVVHTAMLARAVANQPYVPLSAFSVAATIKKGANQGGWCGLAAQFCRDRGIASQAKWPQKDDRYRVYDRPDVWEDAARHKVTEDWVDLTRNLWEQNLTFDQLATCLLSGVPCAVDFNWWGHSVCALDLVEVEAGSFGIRIWNSWADSWGENGTGVLRGSRAIPDGAVATRCTTPG